MPTSTKMPTYPKMKSMNVGKLSKEETGEAAIEKKAALKPMTGKTSCKR